MSTRSATIIRQTTYYGEQADTEELMRFYRHCDGYPEGHGMQMALAVTEADKDGMPEASWLSTVLHEFFKMDSAVHIEFEPFGCEHGDLEYLYVVEGLIDHRWGRPKGGKLPITISAYSIGWDENYADVEKRVPLFSGTAYEYIEKFGGKQ